MSDKQIERAKLIGFFAGVAALSLILRISYSGHLFQDDGLWFTAAEQILRGKALYSEIYFDKPPALPLVYAALFKLFGAHIIIIRLFTVCYSVAISAVLYFFGSWLYDRRTGMLAAGMFAFFSTISVNNHVQGLNTDFLMLLPYTLGAYLLIRACFEQRGLLALAGGALAGIAIQTNPKGFFDLMFFVLILLMGWAWGRLNKDSQFVDFKLSFASATRLLALSAAGVVAGAIPFVAYVAITHSLSDYWLSVWVWGTRYASYSATPPALGRGTWLSATYLVRNNTLLFGLAFVIAVTVRQGIHYRKAQRGQASSEEDPESAGILPADLGSERLLGQEMRAGCPRSQDFRSDVTILLWLAVSYAGVMAGGRFYSNYFFQILPSLCLIGARGLIGITSALKAKPPGLRRATTILIAICFVITAVRFHTRTAVLAAGWMRGTSGGTNGGWYHNELNREEQLVAALVRDLPDGADRIERAGVEALRAGRPPGTVEGPADYLFVWGSRDEIYYWSGLLPASRYLSAQPLTGVPADTQHVDDKSRSILSEEGMAAARAQLVRDLDRARPKYIVDEIGFFNAALSIQSYPELKAFMRNYRAIGAAGRFLIYRWKEEDDSSGAQGAPGN
ncbi:MAG: glycosyltransferase family 39 protein [Acidobacteriota bacterium]